MTNYPSIAEHQQQQKEIYRDSGETKMDMKKVSKQKCFQFTENVYTGKKSYTVLPIDWFISGIATTLDSNREDIFVYDLKYEDISDAGDNNFLWFKLNSKYITELRHSPEYHDAILSHISNLPAHRRFAAESVRHSKYQEYKEVMRDFGVLGTISIYPNNEELFIESL